MRSLARFTLVVMRRGPGGPLLAQALHLALIAELCQLGSGEAAGAFSTQNPCGQGFPVLHGEVRVQQKKGGEDGTEDA